jgi:hypothetical protein
MIEEHLSEIDRILTNECFFCGSLLMDMIDNDIELRKDEGERDIEEE